MYLVVLTISACNLLRELYFIVGQLSIDKLQKWRIKKAIMLNYPELNELEWLALTTDEQDVARRVRHWF